MNPAPPSMPRVRIQSADFDLAREISELRAGDGRVGAVCSFVGTVRDRTAGTPGRISSMELEHYPGMTEACIASLAAAAAGQHGATAVLVRHRIGLVLPGDAIVLVAVTSAHRGQSFQACEFLMDYLKTQAPFWKKEQTPDGARWVDARVSDDLAMAKWGLTSAQGANSG